MKIINGFDLMRYAERKGYMLPAFNTTNLEMTYGIVSGLNAQEMPGYIQISSSNLKLSSPYAIAAIVKEALGGTEMPIALHLDHGKSFQDVKDCIDAGFTSIMIDASHLPYEENVKEVKRVAEYCHFYGIPVEAELGALQGKEDEVCNEAEAKTDPEMAADFVQRTDCDLLAVSVGNVHGLDIEPKIDLSLLKKISGIVRCPLVMHGGSGIPFGIIREARQYHLLKINYGAELRKCYIRTFGEMYEQNHNAHDVCKLSVKAVESVSKRVRELVVEINK